MAELFFLGQLLGAKDFAASSLYCKWKLIAGSGWKFLEGVAEGQTQIDTSSSSGGQLACWAHPIDVHLATKGIQGWPKILLEVWHRDSLERCSLLSYGVVALPSAPGHYPCLVCPTWAPVGSIVDRLASLFNGETLQLAEESFVYSAEHRHNLQTTSMGEVHLELNVILKDFEKFGVETH